MTHIYQNGAEDTINETALTSKVPSPNPHNSTLFSAQISLIWLFKLKYFSIQASNLHVLQPKDIMQFLKLQSLLYFFFLLLRHFTYYCLFFESPGGDNSHFRKFHANSPSKRFFFFCVSWQQFQSFKIWTLVL